MATYYFCDEVVNLISVLDQAAFPFVVPGESGGPTRPGNDCALAETVLVSSATTTIA